MAQKLSEKQARRAQERKQQRRNDAKKARKKKQHKKALIIVIICVVAALIIAGVSTFFAVKRPLTHMISAQKTTHYQLTAAEVSFYAWQIYQEYGDSAVSLGMDADKPLSDQDFDDTMTWEDYFIEAGVEYAESLLIYCDAAAEDGTFSPEDYEDTAREILDYYDTSTLPKFVSEDDAIYALELYLVASDEYDLLLDTVEVTDDEMESYYNENPIEMQSCSYITFSFYYDDSDDISYYMTSDEARDEASDLRRCTTLETFEDWIVDYYMDNIDDITEEEIRLEIADLYAKDITYSEGDEISEWAFDSSTKVGDTTIVDDGAGTLTVALLTAEPERDESYPVTLRHILFTTDTYGTIDDAINAAEEVKAEWESGDRTEDSFAELADNYSEDTSASGGLYEEVIQGQLLTSWKTWLSNPARQYGDVEILKSSTSVSLAYYISADDTPIWQQTAYEAVLSDKYDVMYEEYFYAANWRESSFVRHFMKVLR